MLWHGSNQSLYDTYHGVYVNVQYMITVDMQRGMMAKNMKKSKEFIVEVEVCTVLPDWMTSIG